MNPVPFVPYTCSGHKRQALRASGTLNPHPDRVQATLFQGNPFFDAHDYVQVKYEMLRCVWSDGLSVQCSAELLGFSRMAWYQIKAKYDPVGLAGLLPQRRGSKGLKKRVRAAPHQPHAAAISAHHFKHSSTDMSNSANKRLHLIRADRHGIAASASC